MFCVKFVLNWPRCKKKSIQTDKQIDEETDRQRTKSDQNSSRALSWGELKRSVLYCCLLFIQTGGAKLSMVTAQPLSLGLLLEKFMSDLNTVKKILSTMLSHSLYKSTLWVIFKSVLHKWRNRWAGQSCNTFYTLVLHWWSLSSTGPNIDWIWIFFYSKVFFLWPLIEKIILIISHQQSRTWYSIRIFYHADI